MFGQTQNSTLFGLLIFAAMGAVMGAAGCTRRPESAFGDGRPPPCGSVVHENRPQVPPPNEPPSKESRPDERVCAKPDAKAQACAPCKPTICEPTVCDECPEPAVCGLCPECVECEVYTGCEEEPDVPDARGCLSTAGDFPVRDDQVALTSMNLNIEWTCSIFSEPWWTFTSLEEDPLEFLLLPTPDRLYRVEVRPLSGNIALGYEEGDVVHDDETGIYTWYLVRWSDDFGALGEEEIPARLDVISLTPRSRFKVQVKRGE